MAAPTDPPTDPEAENAGRFPRVRAWARGAHPFFWLVVVALVPAVLVAGAVDAEEPSWALRSGAVYRVEVGLAVFLAAYLVALALANGYKGQAIGKLALPGGSGMEPQDPALEKASEGAAEFQAGARKTLDDHTDLMDDFNARLGTLEDRDLGRRLATLEDRVAAWSQRAAQPTPDRDGSR